MNHKRYLTPFIIEDLANKMVFLAGPRQVGKTILSKQILKLTGNGEYFLWDNRSDRKKMMDSQWPSDESYVVLNELHKYKKWESWLKGEWDKNKDHLKILVTGSARMDVYRKGGDSLQGRYHHYRLHPFSLNEIKNKIGKNKPFEKLEFEKSGSTDDLDALMKFSGFPEPLFAKSEKTHRRWQKERLERVFREDIRDLENIRDMSSLQLLADMLPDRVASPLSLNSLREDLEVSHRSVSSWIDILERLYFLFKVTPFTANKIRGVKKEYKIYMYDWTLVDDEGKRFENLLANHLLKFVNFLEDVEGYKTKLHFLRDVNKREIDFLVTCDGKPWFAVEAKLTNSKLSNNLKYFRERLEIPFIYQVLKETDEDFIKDDIRVMPATKFLTALV